MNISRVVVMSIGLTCINPLANALTPVSLNTGASMSSQNQLVSKGGIGIINKNLYIDLKSSANRLILAHGEKWNGLDSSHREIVFVIEERVFQGDNVPEDFNLSRAIIISFENDRVRFFDFKKLTGGYYLKVNN